MSVESMLRNAIVAVSGHRTVRALFETYGMKLGVARFVAAEQLEHTLDVVAGLNGRGLLATLDYLGESVADRHVAAASADQAIAALRGIRARGLSSNVSVKLTQLGLHIDPAFCEAQLERIVEEAARTGNFVRIDMEDSSVTGTTLDMFVRLFGRYGTERLGAVLQSYLYRSEADRERLGALGANVRIVKGAYKEPKQRAYPHKKDVDANYVRLVERHLLQGNYTAVATHDERIIAHVLQFVESKRIPADRFEFQMLYGIAPSLQLRLAGQGFRVRVYTPFGESWYPYFSRRIAERPANLWFVMKGIFRL